MNKLERLRIAEEKRGVEDDEWKVNLQCSGWSSLAITNGGLISSSKNEIDLPA